MTCLWRRTGLCGATNFAGFRFRVNRRFYTEVDRQIASLLKENPNGIVARLHVAGDFVSVAYVRFWVRKLRKFERLHLWGHTAHRGAMLLLIQRD